jgi:hypothetical protein
MRTRTSSWVRAVSASLLTAPIALSNSPVVAAADCVGRPNGQVPPGAHWYYHFDRTSERKCWFLGMSATETPQAPAPELQPAEPSPPPAIASLFSLLTGRPTAVTSPESGQDATKSDSRLIQTAPTKVLKLEDIVPRELTLSARRSDSNGLLISNWRQKSPSRRALKQTNQRDASQINQAEHDALFREYLRWQELQNYSHR